MMFRRWKVHRKAISQNRKTAQPVCKMCVCVCLSDDAAQPLSLLFPSLLIFETGPRFRTLISDLRRSILPTLFPQKASKFMTCNLTSASCPPTGAEGASGDVPGEEKRKWHVAKTCVLFFWSYLSPSSYLLSWVWCTIQMLSLSVEVKEGNVRFILPRENISWLAAQKHLNAGTPNKCI